MNPFDEIAVEEALRLKEAGKATEMVAVSIGPRRPGNRSAPPSRWAPIAASRSRPIGDVEPLAVAKLLKAIVDEEKPASMILGKQAIDDDCNQTGQMLAALLGWAQATFASKLDVGGEARKVTREVDGGLRDPRAEAAGDRDHRSAAQRAALCQLPNIMKAKKKPIDDKTAGRSRRRSHAASRRS